MTQTDKRLLGILKGKAWFSLDIVQWSLLKMLGDQLTHWGTGEPEREVAKTLNIRQDGSVGRRHKNWFNAEKKHGVFISTECLFLKFMGG